MDPGALRLEGGRRIAALALAVVAAAAAVERFVGSLSHSSTEGDFVFEYDRVHLPLILGQLAAAAAIAALATHGARRRYAPLGLTVGVVAALLVYAAIWFVPGLMDQAQGPL